MSLQVDVDESAREVVIRFGGIDAMWALQSEQRLSFDVVTGARVVSRSDARADIGWRVGGAYWPGLIASGRFTVKGRKGARQLWLGFGDPEGLAIDTSLERPCRVVLQTPDRVALAQRIEQLTKGDRP
jgi:hypothetical protein